MSTLMSGCQWLQGQHVIMCHLCEIKGRDAAVVRGQWV